MALDTIRILKMYSFVVPLLSYTLPPLMTGICHPEKFSDILYWPFYETQTDLAKTSDTLQIYILYDFDDRIKAPYFNNHYYLNALLVSFFVQC